MQYLFCIISLSFFIFSCGNKTSKEEITESPEPLIEVEEKEQSSEDDSYFYSPQQVADSIARVVTNFPETYYPHIAWEDVSPKAFIIRHVLGCQVVDDEKYVLVDLSVLTDETIALFKEHIINSAYLKFRKNSLRIPINRHLTKNYKEAESLGYQLITPHTLFTGTPPEKITVTMINPTDTDIMTGTYYWVDYKNGKNWEVIEFISNNGSALVFNDLGFPIPAGSQKEFTISLYPEWYQYEPGEYRIRKPFHRKGEFTMRGQERVWEDYFVTTSFKIKAD